LDRFSNRWPFAGFGRCCADNETLAAAMKLMTYGGVLIEQRKGGKA
jgi:hypothetical protein